MTMVSKYCIRIVLLTLTVVLQYHAVDGLDEYLTNDEKGGKRPVRVVIPSFQLTLDPTPDGPLSPIQEAQVHSAANTILELMMPSLVPQGITVEYVKLVTAFAENSVRHAMRHRHERRKLQTTTTNATTNTTTNTTTSTTSTTSIIEIDGGVASFRNGKPTVEEVNAWVSEALQQPLLEYLQEETDLSYLESITFTSLTASPTSAPVILSDNNDITKLTSPDHNNNNNISINGMMVGIIAAVIALVGIMAAMIILAIRRKRSLTTTTTTKSSTHDGGEEDPVVVLTKIERNDFKDNHHDDHDHDEDDQEDDDVDEVEDEVNDDLPSSQQTNRQYGDTSSSADSPSVSTSEWTLSTTATDAFTVNSANSISGMARFGRAGRSLLQTESFERDRQITIKKDMLQTTWSTTNVANNNYPKGKEAVLMPSHFTVDTLRDNISFDDDFDDDDDDDTARTSQDSTTASNKSSSKHPVAKDRPFYSKLMMKMSYSCHQVKQDPVELCCSTVQELLYYSVLTYSYVKCLLSIFFYRVARRPLFPSECVYLSTGGVLSTTRSNIHWSTSNRRLKNTLR